MVAAALQLPSLASIGENNFQANASHHYYMKNVSKKALPENMRRLPVCPLVYMDTHVYPILEGEQSLNSLAQCW